MSGASGAAGSNKLTDLKPQGSFVCTSGVLLWGTLGNIVEAKTKLDDNKYDAVQTDDEPNFKCRAAKGRWIRCTGKEGQGQDNGWIGLFYHADSITPDQLMACHGVRFAKPFNECETHVVLTDPSWSMTMPDEDYLEESDPSSDNDDSEEDMEVAEMEAAELIRDELLFEEQAVMMDNIKPAEGVNLDHLDSDEDEHYTHFLQPSGSDEDEHYTHFLQHIDKLCCSDKLYCKKCEKEFLQKLWSCEECGGMEACMEAWLRLEGTWTDGFRTEDFMVELIKAKVDKQGNDYLLKDANDQACGMICANKEEEGVCARLIFNDDKELIGMKYIVLDSDSGPLFGLDY